MKLKYERLRADLIQSRAKEYQIIVLDVLALVKARVINSGKNAEGSFFSPYSQAVVPYWYYGSVDGVTSSDLNRLKESKGYFASYRDLREVKGRPTNIKNFSFTNKMWNSLQPFPISDNANVLTIGYKVAGDREEVLNIHHAKDGILDYSDDEKKLLDTLSAKRLRDAFKRNGL